MKAQRAKDKHVDFVEGANSDHSVREAMVPAELAEAEIEYVVGHDDVGSEETALAAGSDPSGEAASLKGPAVAFDQEVQAKLLPQRPERRSSG